MFSVLRKITKYIILAPSLSSLNQGHRQRLTLVQDTTKFYLTIIPDDCPGQIIVGLAGVLCNVSRPRFLSSLSHLSSISNSIRSVELHCCFIQTYEAFASFRPFLASSIPILRAHESRSSFVVKGFRKSCFYVFCVLSHDSASLGCNLYM